MLERQESAPERGKPFTNQVALRAVVYRASFLGSEFQFAYSPYQFSQSEQHRLRQEEFAVKFDRETKFLRQLLQESEVTEAFQELIMDRYIKEIRGKTPLYIPRFTIHDLVEGETGMGIFERDGAKRIEAHAFRDEMRGYLLLLYKAQDVQNEKNGMQYAEAGKGNPFEELHFLSASMPQWYASYFQRFGDEP